MDEGRNIISFYLSMHTKMQVNNKKHNEFWKRTERIILSAFSDIKKLFKYWQGDFVFKKQVTIISIS